MQPRAVRIPIYDAVVTFDEQPATLVNISRTGALLRVHAAARVGRESAVVITHNRTTIQLDARVVRSSSAPVPGGPHEGEWHTGIRFVAPPPIEITQLLRRIISVAERA